MIEAIDRDARQGALAPRRRRVAASSYPMRAAILLFVLLAAGPALGGSIRDCRLTQKPDAWFSGGEYAVALSDGYLRMLLIRRSDGPSSVMDFVPWKEGNSVHTEIRSGDDTEAEFWVANAKSDGKITIDRWEIAGSGADREPFVLDCSADPAAAPLSH